MSHFAKVENGIVTDIIVAEQDVIDSGLFGTGWIQTSYNTWAGNHPLSAPMRKNYAVIGGRYDAENDAFIPLKPFPSWVLDNETFVWKSPVPYPKDGKFYDWDEGTTSWMLVSDFRNPPQPSPVLELTTNDSIINNATTFYLSSNSSDTITVELSSNGADSINGAI